jgi:hypothetical protein
MRWEEQVLNKSEMYWDAARANILLDQYEVLEAAARELCNQFRNNPFGNLGAAIARLDEAKRQAGAIKESLLEGVCAGL